MNATERGAAEAAAMIAPLAGDEPRARALSGKLVIGERNLERGIDRLGARVAEEDAVEIARRKLGQARGQRKGRGVRRLEGRGIVEPPRLTADRLNDRFPAMTGVAAPQPRHGIDQLAPVRGVVVHALGAIDEARTPLESTVGGEGKPIGGKLGFCEAGREWSV
jgi:hypothetical protein